MAITHSSNTAQESIHLCRMEIVTKDSANLQMDGVY